MSEELNTVIDFRFLVHAAVQYIIVLITISSICSLMLTEFGNYIMPLLCGYSCLTHKQYIRGHAI